MPDRLREGYGPNTSALLRLREEGARVVVTVDCGTTRICRWPKPPRPGSKSSSSITMSPSRCCPCAIGDRQPEPARRESPHGVLAAVGVAFLLVVAVNRALRQGGWYVGGRTEPDLMEWLDLVALGTVCDVVPLAGFNRALVAQGIKVARRSANPGLVALAAVAGIAEPLDAYHLGFVLGPRVNAGGPGRGGRSRRKPARDRRSGARRRSRRRLDAYNRERRDIEARTLEAAIATVEGAAQSPVLVFAAAEDWHPGVIGIVAARSQGAL